MTRIQVLPPEEARKIAAGEVVDRPAALVREFMDNAIDAGAALVEVIIEDGGAARVEVSDDGEGMSRDDLELCWLTHATSKIRSLDDLREAETLGFRGEALAAAAAVARLEIVSSVDGREAWKLDVGPGMTPPTLTQVSRARGTSARAIGLFSAIPARKRFLKREGSEAAACRQIFNEKAMAFPAAAFRFLQDGRLKNYFPPASSYKERFRQILLSRDEGAFLHEIAATGTGFSVAVVAGGPELSRGDRRQQYVFANGRRIQDFSLIQALEYGLQGWFPNGTHPVGAVYVDVSPELADFNIHPAKREVRFADAGAIHHAVTSALRDFCARYDRRREGVDSGAGRADVDAELAFQITASAAPDDLAYDGPGYGGQADGPAYGGMGGNAADGPAYGGAGGGPADGPAYGGVGGGPADGPAYGDPADAARDAAVEALRAPAGAWDADPSMDISAGPGAAEPSMDTGPGAAGPYAAGVNRAGGPVTGAAWAAESRPPYDRPGGPAGAGRLSGPERPAVLGSLRYLGRLFGLFVLVEKDDRLFIIDQHAAHERILYDRLLAGPVPRQDLLVAIPFTTDSDEEDRFIETRRADLEKLGVVIEGEERGWRIEALPAGWRLSDTETVAEILKLKTAGENMAERWAATLCCHGAVRDGDYLDPGSALALADAAFKAAVWRCPHGRPLWMEISRDDICRAVKRI